MLRVTTGYHPKRGKTTIYDYNPDSNYTVYINNSAGATRQLPITTRNVIGGGSCNGKFDIMQIVTNQTTLDLINQSSSSFAITPPSTTNNWFILSYYSDGKLVLSISKAHNSDVRTPFLTLTWDKDTESFINCETKTDSHTGDLIIESICEVNITTVTTQGLPVYLTTNNNQSTGTGLGYWYNTSDGTIRVSASTTNVLNSGSSNKTFAGCNHGFSIYHNAEPLPTSITEKINDIENELNTTVEKTDNAVNEINKISGENINYYVSR